MDNNSYHESQIHNFNQGSFLPILENYFWLIEQGVVKTYTWNEEGSETVLGYWGQGDVVGQPLSPISPYAIKCLTKITASLINLQSGDRLSPCIYKHIQQSEELLYIIRSDRVYDKLKRLLIWFANKFGQEVEEGTLITFPLTHQELSDALSATRVSLTKLVNQLEQEKFLVRRGRKYIIVDSEI